MTANIGDYVLATKYADGDPLDHFAVGFVSGMTHRGRYLVVDDEGQKFRANGFRRVERITADEGRELFRRMLNATDSPASSVWDWLADIRLEQF